jgi:murein DD-endopeptidase MepM/ murein hydrolase activator NlpD
VHQQGDGEVHAVPAGVNQPSPSPSISPDDGVEGPAEDAIVGDATLVHQVKPAGAVSKKTRGGSKGSGTKGSSTKGTGTEGTGTKGTGTKGSGNTDGRKAAGSGKNGGSTSTNGNSPGGKGSGPRSAPVKVPSVEEVLRLGSAYSLTVLPKGFPFLTCPVHGRFAYSDDYGAPRYAGGYHPHAGNDIFADFNTPIVAPFDGYVEKVPNTLGGNAVEVHGALGYVYMAHLIAYGPGVPGNVKAGQVVGFVGNTGDAQGTSPHDHFEWHPNTVQSYDRSLAGANGAVDPFRYLRVVCTPG